MARVNFGDDQRRMRGEYADTAVGDNRVPTRGPIQESKTRPSLDPSNPYENDRYRLKLVAELWSSMRQCKKDYFNHSWQKVKFTGARGKPAVQLQSGYYLGFTKVINSIKPETGEYFDPVCFCFRLLDSAGNPFPATVRWFHISFDGQTHTGYFNEYRSGQPFGGAVAPRHVTALNKLQSPVAIQRSSAYMAWLESLNPRDYLVMWYPFALSWFGGTSYLWDCDEWLLFNQGQRAGFGSGTLKLRWCPNGCKQSLCSADTAIVTLNCSDAGCHCKIEHASDGTPVDVMWNGKKMGEITAGGDGQSITSSFFFPPFEKMDSKDNMVFFHKPDPCHYRTVPDGLIQKGKLIKKYTLGNECSGGGVDRQLSVFEFEEPIRFNRMARNPKLKVYVDGPYYDKRGFQTFYPWGGIFMQVSNSPDGPWCNVWANPVVECVEGKEAYCFDFWQLCEGTWKYIRMDVDNGPYAWQHCTRTSVTELYVNDKLFKYLKPIEEL